MQKIFFRADAGADIGYGHFVRTLALADMLKDDFECVFVSQSPTVYQRSEIAKVCKLIEVPATDEKFGLFLKMLKGDEIVVLDNYFNDTDYQHKIKTKGCKLVCIDDMHDKHYVADVVINHGLTNRNLFDAESYTKFCLGLDWALLRAPFLKTSRVSFVTSIKKIALGFGGSDRSNLTANVINLLLVIPGMETIIAIVGDAYQYSYINDSRVCYRKNLSAEEIVRIFHGVDLAILPASTMSLEALACGTVLAAGYYVDNQVEVYHELVKHHRVLPLGDFSSKELRERIHEILSLPFPESWEKGDIKERYLKLFKSLHVKDYQIEEFCFIDYRNLSDVQNQEVWLARTDDRIRCWMMNQGLFSFESHVDFVNSLRSSTEKIYWAVYKDNQFIGSINIHRAGQDCAERGIFMNPNLIGKTIGKTMEECSYSIYRDLGISFLKAEIRKENERSLKYHLKMGYRVESENENFYFLIKILNEV